ncbi:MAG: hypothetical protein B7Y86_09990 [Brevundimonas subvibrioides]|uniref:DNA-binding response regulator n=1 Tax=Brevundimonas subvibrioides TaxID=74313 RepID=A0A258HL32_9CAUL|nr:response regulator [Brevundimonas subvibrioides]OYX57052.1 MAG: hypothetical protein B7Y86_09990 [Brevundimonas subvibrioides]
MHHIPFDRIVHIVDADPAARQHGAAVLRASNYEVRTHASGSDFLLCHPDPHPGCILLDIHMPEPDGLDVQDKLIQAGQTMPVIVFTGENALDIAVRAMRAGALWFLEKPYLDADLVRMVGEAIARQDATEDSADRKAIATAQIDSLSPREIQVMQGLAEGWPNKIIAHELGLSIRTVEMYRTNLMKKLEAHSLSTVLRLWFDAGR